MKLLRLLSILLLTCNFAIAQISQQTIVDEITANLPTNNRNEISAELLRNTLNQMTSAIFQNQGLSGLTITGTPTIGQALIATGSTTASWQSIGSGQVASVTNSDGSLLINPSTGNVVGSLNVGHVNTWLALQNLSVGGTSLTLSSTDNSTNIATTAFVQTVISTSIPSTLTFASPSALANATIPASVSSARVTAMANSGTSTCGLNFNKGNSTPTGVYGEILNSSSNVYWEPQYSTNPMRACEFGTIADGTINATTNVIAGTDDTAIIQAALNYALQNELNAVCLNDGAYKMTDTLHLGWGDSFYSVSLTSCNNNRAGGQGNLAGVQIYSTVTDRCAVNIQGGRNDTFKGISLYGMNYSWVFNGMATSPWPTTNSGWLNTSLIPTGTNPGGITRYAPYSGICEDAYSGQPPSALGSNAQYPFVTNYPAFTQLATTAASISQASPAIVNWGTTANNWLNANCNLASAPAVTVAAICPIIFTAGSLPAGFSLNTLYYVKTFISGNTFTISATPGGAALNNANPAASGLAASRQFGMALSSATTIQGDAVTGFAVNINFGSSPTNQQGDFLIIDDVALQNCVYCLSVSNDQSRNVNFNNIKYAFCHTVLTNNQFGEQAGKLGGPINNISGGECYQLFQIGGLSFGFPTTINDLYAESITRIGSFAGGSNANSVTFNGADLGFGTGIGGAGASATIPIAYLEATGGKTTFILNSVNLANGVGRIDSILHGPGSLEITGGSIVNGQSTLPKLNSNAGYPGIPVAFNYTGGAFVGGTVASFPTTNAYALVWNSPTSASAMSSQTVFVSQQLQKQADFNSFSNRAPFTQATRGFFDQFNHRWFEFAMAPVGSSVNLGNGSVSNTLVLTCDVLTFNYVSAQQAVNAPSSNISPGNILYYTGDGTFFVVATVGAISGGAYPVTAIQMNNMVVNGTTGACVSSNISDATMAAANTAIIPNAGTNYADVTLGATPSNIMIPSTLFFGNFISGSTAVGFVSFSSTQPRGDTLATYQVAGDLFWGPQSFTDPTLPFPYPPGGKWSSLSAGTSSTFGSAVLNVASNFTGRFPLSPLPIIGVGSIGPTPPFRYSAAGVAIPTCNAATNGNEYLVSDATSPTYHGAYSSGGAVLAKVVCINGTGLLTE